MDIQRQRLPILVHGLVLLLLGSCLSNPTVAAFNERGQKCCPPNEVLLWCPPVCEPTCDNDCVPTPTGIPVETCVCRPGFVRHNGHCIEKSACPAPCTEPPKPPCPITFHATTKQEGFPAPRPCHASYPRPVHAPAPYSMGSQSQNFSYGSNYLYRPVRPCPPRHEPTTTVSPFEVCPPNEVTRPSPVCCEPTCKSNCAAVLCPAKPPTGPPVCTCAEGFVRHEGRCVRPEDCPSDEPPKFCGPNAHYSPCTPCCQKTCDNDCSRIFCIAACTGPPTCVCNEGFVLHKGRCILPSECPPKCHPSTPKPPPPTTPCPPRCPPGATLRPFRPCCVDTCTTDCRLVRCAESFTGPPTCVCEYGLVMHNNCCIPREHCPKPDCGNAMNPYAFLMEE
uniref:EGF-like domain-containing protein n=1 Tax=Anopheles atroparvus TaxID=41427 RepID=A0A182JB49_ANOAO